VFLALSDALPVLLFGLLGLIVGSFLAAVSVRLPLGEDVVLGRSRCRSCETPLKPWHLVPVASWVALRGRCGFCAEPIGRRYLLIELGAATVGVWAALNGGGWVHVALTAVLGWQLLLIAVVDGEHQILPDALTWPLIATGLIGGLVEGEPLARLVGALAGFGVLWLIGWAYERFRGRRGLGDGDPFLLAGAGAWVGWMGVPSVLVWACAVGLSLVLARLLARRPVAMTDRTPFGLYLAVGAWLTWLTGPLGT
jgi:leader peptidase (prepilin peptidase)/N-methyltransferase